MPIKNLIILSALALSTNAHSKSCGSNSSKSSGKNYQSKKTNGYNFTNTKHKGNKGKSFSSFGCKSFTQFSGVGCFGNFDKITKTVTTTKKVVKTSLAPTGQLSLDKALIREGKAAKVTWTINYPSTVIEDVVDISYEGEVTAKTKLRADVYMIGAAVSNHTGWTQSQVKLGSSGWKTVYNGYGKDINSSVVKVSSIINQGDTVSFKAYTDTWDGTPGWVKNTSDNVLVMRNGDKPNSTEGWGGDSSMEDYVRPYMENGVMKLGSLDLMMAAELTHSQKYINDSGYDSNDSIILIRFTAIN